MAGVVRSTPAAVRRRLEGVDAFQQRHPWLAFPVAVLSKFNGDQGGSLAGLITYYGLLSMFPLLLAFAGILGLVLGGHPHLQAQVLRTVQASFPAFSAYLSTTFRGGGVATGLGSVGALWAGLGVVLSTERAMNIVWYVPVAERPNLWWSRLRALAMLAILGLTFLLSTALSALREVGGALAIPAAVVGVVGGLLLNLALFLLAFQILTNHHLAWRSLLPGAVLGAVGWTALQNVGVFYVHHEVSHLSQLYGTLATVIGLMAWLYLGARLVLYCAEVNAVLALHLWPRSLTGGVRTAADREAATRQMQAGRRSAGETVTVSFATGGESSGRTEVSPRQG